VWLVYYRQNDGYCIVGLYHNKDAAELAVKDNNETLKEIDNKEKEKCRHYITMFSLNLTEMILISPNMPISLWL